MHGYKTDNIVMSDIIIIVAMYVYAILHAVNKNIIIIYTCICEV